MDITLKTNPCKGALKQFEIVINLEKGVIAGGTNLYEIIR